LPTNVYKITTSISDISPQSANRLTAQTLHRLRLSWPSTHDNITLIHIKWLPISEKSTNTEALHDSLYTYTEPDYKW